MALKLNERYPQRWDSPSNDYPQGAFKNLTELGEQDGSYLEQDWLNDYSGFFGALLRNAEMTPNGTIDTAQRSQFYDALVAVAKKSVTDALNKKWDIQATTGTGNVARMSEVDKKRNKTDNDFVGSLLALRRSAGDEAYVGLHATSDGRYTITRFSDAGDFHSFIPNKTGTIAHISDIPQLTSTLSDREDLAVTPKAVNTVNKEVNKKRNKTDNDFVGSLLALRRSAGDEAYVGLHATSDGRYSVTRFSSAGDFHSFIPNKTGTIAHTSDVLGIGQEWVDVTSQRVVGTTYTNNTGKPIYISVSMGAGEGNAKIFIDGKNVSIVDRVGSSPTSVYAIIPMGSTYRATMSKSLSSWFELR